MTMQQTEGVRTFRTPHDLLLAVGTTFGPTSSVRVDQAMINQFADVTGDHQWVHVDPVRSAAGPFQGMIAHGFLTLSLIASFLPQLLVVEGGAMSVNVGLNHVRFVSPVRSGAQLIARASLIEALAIGEAVQATLHVIVEEEGADRPACVADIIIRHYPQTAGGAL